MGLQFILYLLDTKSIQEFHITKQNPQNLTLQCVCYFFSFLGLERHQKHNAKRKTQQSRLILQHISDTERPRFSTYKISIEPHPIHVQPKTVQRQQTQNHFTARRTSNQKSTNPLKREEKPIRTLGFVNDKTNPIK